MCILKFAKTKTFVDLYHEMNSELSLCKSSQTILSVYFYFSFHFMNP